MLATFLVVATIFYETFGQYPAFNIETNEAGPFLPSNFLSVTLDAYLANDWQDYQFSNTLLNTAAKNFGDTIFRYSGTNSDDTFYNVSGNANNNPKNLQFLNVSQVQQLSDFAATNNWKFIFGLNAANERNVDGSWDSTNAKQLISSIAESTNIYAFELGNEPEWYTSFGWPSVNASQIVNDANTLHQLINDIYTSRGKKVPFIFGPDTNLLQEWMDPYTKYIKQRNYNYLTNFTWHHYFDSGYNWGYWNFLNVTMMDTLIQPINDSINIVYDNLGDNVNVILGETAPQWGADQNYSQSFLMGFMWMDELGLAATFGLNGVYRQCFWNNKVGLVGTDYKINPDYWTSLLFKNLVGNNAVMVDGQFDPERYLRIYAFCTRTKEDGSMFDYIKGSITVQYINVNDINVTFPLTFNGAIDTMNSYYDGYYLTSYPGVTNSRSIYLNGKVIEMIDDSTMPNLNYPTKTPFGTTIHVDAFSYGFIVVANANASACL